MHFSPHQMVLFPADPQAVAAPEKLHRCLMDIGLLSTSLGAGYHATGDRFPALICFLGCSPHLELEPREAAPFCYVQLPVDATQQRFELIRKAPRQTASWVVVGNIHEAEATPDAALLAALEGVSGCHWKYGYRR